MKKKSRIDWFSIIIASIFGFVFSSALMVDRNREYDSTDDGTTRSGLTLYVDHMTGCHYLEAGYIGGITPRLDGQGRHVGCKPSNPIDY